MKIFLTILFLFSIAYGQTIQIPVSDANFYDASGVTGKSSPGMFKYFGSTSDDGRLVSYVADFNGDSIRRIGNGLGVKGLIITQGAEFVLDSITYNDPSGSVDTIWIYTFDQDNPPTLDQLANTHNYTPDYTIISCGTCAGIPINVKINATADDKTKFFYIDWRRTNLFSGLWPNIRAIKFWGHNSGRTNVATYDINTSLATNWTPPTIGQQQGHFNLLNQYDTTWIRDTLEKYGYFRSFDQMFFDDENVPYGQNRINMGGAGFNAYAFNKWMSTKGHYQFAAFFNKNKRLEQQMVAAGYSSADWQAKWWSIDSLGANPYRIQSYYRLANYMYVQAAIGGSNASPNTAPIRTTNGTPTYGQGSMKIMSPGNEITGFFFPHQFSPPLMVSVRQIATYDSVKAADPNMIVTYPGFEAYNWRDALYSAKFTQIITRSSSVKADGTDIHAITTMRLDSFEVIPNTSQQIGNHGVSSGFNKTTWRKIVWLTNYIRQQINDANFKFYVSEYTKQKNKYIRYPRDGGETFSISQQGCPYYTVEGVKLDFANSHMVDVLQEDAMLSATDVEQAFYYQLVDDKVWTDSVDGGDGTFDATDANNGKFSRPFTCCTEMPVAWPTHYGTTGRQVRWKDYHCIDTLSIVPGGLFVFKYVHNTIPDSIRFEYFIGDSSATGTFVLPIADVGGVTSGKVLKPSGTSFAQISSDVSATGGNFSLPADPLPRSLLVFAPGTNLSPNANAGSDQIITIPTASVSVSASASSDPDGTIASYAWTKISGPATFNIVSPTSATTTINTLVAGTYVFQVEVTDNEGATDTDTITVIVLNPTGLIIKRKLVVPQQ